MRRACQPRDRPLEARAGVHARGHEGLFMSPMDTLSPLDAREECGAADATRLRERGRRSRGDSRSEIAVGAGSIAEGPRGERLGIAVPRSSAPRGTSRGQRSFRRRGCAHVTRGARVQCRDSPRNSLTTVASCEHCCEPRNPPGYFRKPRPPALDVRPHIRDVSRVHRRVHGAGLVAPGRAART